MPYTVKIMTNDGESIRLYSATHVVIDKKEGTIDVCNTGKPTSRVTLPDDGDVVYVVNEQNRTVETLRAPSAFEEELEDLKRSAMEMHTTRSPQPPQTETPTEGSKS